MRRISRLRMTGHPFILVSAVLPKSFQICLQLVNQKQEYTLSTQRVHRYALGTQRVHKEYTRSTHLVHIALRMKGGWKGDDELSIHYRNAHQQDVSMADERKKRLFGQGYRAVRLWLFMWQTALPDTFAPIEKWACIKEMQNANKKIAFYSSTKKYLCSFALNDKGICTCLRVT